MYSMRTQVLRKLFLVPTPSCPPLIAYFRPVGNQILHLMWPKTIYLCVPHLSYSYGFISVLCRNNLFMSYVFTATLLAQIGKSFTCHTEKRKTNANERDVVFSAMLAL